MTLLLVLLQGPLTLARKDLYAASHRFILYNCFQWLGNEVTELNKHKSGVVVQCLTTGRSVCAGGYEQ